MTIQTDPQQHPRVIPAPEPGPRATLLDYHKTKRTQKWVAPSIAACGCFLQNEPNFPRFQSKNAPRPKNKPNSALDSHPLSMVYLCKTNPKYNWVAPSSARLSVLFAKRSQFVPFSIKNQRSPIKRTQIKPFSVFLCSWVYGFLGSSVLVFLVVSAKRTQIHAFSRENQGLPKKTNPKSVHSVKSVVSNSVNFLDRLRPGLYGSAILL